VIQEMVLCFAERRIKDKQRIAPCFGSNKDGRLGQGDVSFWPFHIK